MVLIVLTVERFVTICFPYQTIITITKRKLAGLLLFLTVSTACLTSHFWWTFSLYEQNDNVSQNFLAGTPMALNFSNHENMTRFYITSTKLECTSKNDFVYKYWPWINLAVYSLIPFFIITTSNLLLLIRLRYSVYERKKNLGQVTNSFHIGSSSLLLISAGLLYLFCTCPMAIYHITYIPGRELYRSLMRVILENVSYLTNALNLLVYCISGSRFRRELILMMSCKTANSQGKPFDRTLSKSVSSLNTFVQSYIPWSSDGSRISRGGGTYPVPMVPTQHPTLHAAPFSRNVHVKLFPMTIFLPRSATENCVNM